MTLDDICSLPVSDIATKNSVLFLWAVWPRIFDAQDVIGAWGFEYKTIAWVWVKTTRKSGKYFTGMGYYTRANTEPCLLATKGRVPVNARDVQALIVSPVRRHSQKPDEQYAKIARLYPYGKRIELFAREIHSGWDAWGNEINGGIDLR
jgi:N6-adenosine-specific RNA methylase IME4